MFKRSAPLDKRAPTNAYQAFALERRPLLPKDMCCGEREKFIGQLWKALPKTEKDKWKVASNAYTRPVPYYAFCKEQRPLLPPTLQNKERDTALGQMWRALPPTERAKYEINAPFWLPRCAFSFAVWPPHRLQRANCGLQRANCVSCDGPITWRDAVTTATAV